MTTKPNGITPEELTAIRKRAEKATPGPWRYILDDHEELVTSVDVTDTVVETYARDEESDANIEFIAHAREDIPRLFAEIERLRTALEEVNRAWYEDSTDYDFAMKVRTILDRSGFRKGE
jgi:hypothetical protein